MKRFRLEEMMRDKRGSAVKDCLDILSIELGLVIDKRIARKTYQ